MRASDPRGRSRRSDADPRRRPADGHRTTSARRFDQLAEEAVSAIPPHIGDAIGPTEVVVTEVPAADAPLMDGQVPLVQVLRRSAMTRLVIHRRPLEARATGRRDLVGLITAACAAELSRAAGLDWPDDS